MGENRPMADLYEENQRLKARIEELEEKHWNECGQIAHYSDENAKMKELLRKAVEDVRYCMRSYDPCEICALLCEDGECPATDDDDCGEKYKWRHADEALALIGEDTNVPASADDANVSRKSGDWISCKDRMPEINEPVLFIFNTESGFKAVMYGWHETIKGLGSGWHQAGVGGARADEEVTYWQPLPEPPKDGEQDD